MRPELQRNPRRSSHKLLKERCTRSHRIRGADSNDVDPSIRCDGDPAREEKIMGTIYEGYDDSNEFSNRVNQAFEGLDQLAWQLALINNPNPSRDVCFPIFGELKPDTPKKFKKATDDMPPDAAKIIEELQPYKRGVEYCDDPLWQLGELHPPRPTKRGKPALSPPAS